MEQFAERQFTECYRRYHPAVVNYIARRISDEADAKDLAQEVFERIWNVREMVRTETVERLVYTVARNKVTDYIRSRCKRDELKNALMLETETSSRNTVEERLAYKQLWIVHNNVAKNLPQRLRQVYFLYFYKGLSHTSIADKLQLSVRSVDGHLLKACKKVRLEVCRRYVDKTG